jgi:hypothetical protein
MNTFREVGGLIGGAGKFPPQQATAKKPSPFGEITRVVGCVNQVRDRLAQLENRLVGSNPIPSEPVGANPDPEFDRLAMSAEHIAGAVADMNRMLNNIEERLP